MTRLGDIDPKAWVEANQKIILLEDLNRQAESRIAFLETENRKLFAETGAADRLLEAAKAAREGMKESTQGDWEVEGISTYKVWKALNESILNFEQAKSGRALCLGTGEK